MRFSLIIALAPYRDAEILKSINELDFPKEEYEIIIEKGLNASDNRNRGAERSKGEIIVFLDDDGVVPKELLQNASNFFKEHSEIDIVGGPQLTPLDEKGFAKLSGYALSSKFGGWDTSNRYGKKKLNLNVDETHLTTAIMFCKKKVVEEVKFDKKLWPGEDPKFIAEARQKNFKVAYSPDLIIYHRRRPTIKALIKQIFNYGKVGPLRESFLETLRKPFFLIPSLFVIYILFFFLGITITPSLSGYVINENILGFEVKIWQVLIFPLLVYVFLSLIYSFYESIKNKDISGILFLPIIFPIIHISYGAGRIYGSCQKLFGRKN